MKAIVRKSLRMGCGRKITRVLAPLIGDVSRKAEFRIGLCEELLCSCRMSSQLAMIVRLRLIDPLVGCGDIFLRSLQIAMSPPDINYGSLRKRQQGRCQYHKECDTFQ